MIFRTFIISVLLMLISLVATALPNIHKILIQKFKLVILMDNTMMFCVAILGFLALLITSFLEIKKLKKQIKNLKGKTIPSSVNTVQEISTEE